MILLVNPETGGAIGVSPGDRELFCGLVLGGWQPVGPKGQVIAARVRAKVTAQADQTTAPLSVNQSEVLS